MKNRKSLLSVILALAMVFTLCITPAAAVETGSENGATITVEKVTDDTITADSEVALKVSISGNPGFAGYKFEVVYNADKLTLTKITNGTFGGMFTSKLDDNTAVLANAENLEGDGTLFTLKFTVKEAGVDGAAVTVKAVSLYNAMQAKIPVTIVAGGINDTTGGSTTGGSTTGGSTTGGSTTGGSTTGGSTTGGSTTGGSTTGGSTTGGNTTGGDTTDCKHDGAVKLVDNKDGKTHKVYCAECDELLTAKEAHVYQCNKKGEIIGKGGAYCLCGARRSMPSSTTTTTTGTTQSPKTGDMGVVLYAATALLSLSGTAVVIKKRKDR